MRLCCFFNYAPLYRESIYRKIDETFDSQFYFGRQVCEGEISDIAKLDYSIFKKKPIEFKNKFLLKRFAFRTKAWKLAFSPYDTFLITGDFVFSYIPFLIFARLLGKRVYGWNHGIKSWGRTYKLFNKFLYGILTGFFTYGEGGKKRLIELGVNPSKIFVIYNSLTENVNPNENELLKSNIYRNHFGNEYPVLLFVGRLTPQKRLDKLIDMLHTLHRKDNKCNLVFIGTGIEAQKLKEMVDSYGLNDYVWFYGECYDESQNSKLLYNADLCISPGNVGLTALHAMSYGLPVISHNNFETQMPEYETILIGRTGDLFEEGNYDEMTKKVFSWLTIHSKDREQIQKNCYDMINGKWNSHNQIEILKKVLGK